MKLHLILTYMLIFNILAIHSQTERVNGKIIKDFFNEEIIYSNVDLNVFFVGFTSAFITGIIACKWMLKLVKNNKLKYFAYYCFIIGLIAITYHLI